MFHEQHPEKPQPKQHWAKPKVRRLEAGAAETSTGNTADAGENSS
jgi:hypothetical protein